MNGVAAAVTHFDPHEGADPRIVGRCPECSEFGVRAADASCPVCADIRRTAS